MTLEIHVLLRAGFHQSLRAERFILLSSHSVFKTGFKLRETPSSTTLLVLLGFTGIFQVLKYIGK